MSVRAITFDFWDTLFPRLGRETDADVAEARSEAIRAVLDERGREFPIDRCRAAYDAANRGHLEHWHTGMLQPTVDEALDDIARELAVELDEGTRGALAERMQCRPAVLDLDPFPGVTGLLSELGRRFKLGIVSDTWLTPGEVPRLMLERHGMLGLFGAFVFSDETGFLKPHERQFRVAAAALDVPPGEVVHVGDSERRDVLGARALKMRTVLLDWEGTHGESVADAVVRDFAELGPAIERLVG